MKLSKTVLTWTEERNLLSEEYKHIEILLLNITITFWTPSNMFSLVTSVLLLLFSNLNSKVELNPEWGPNSTSSAHVRVVPRGALSETSIFSLHHTQDAHGSAVKSIAGCLKNHCQDPHAFYLAVTPDLSVTLTPHADEGMHFVPMGLATSEAGGHVLSPQPVLLRTTQNGSHYYLHVCLGGYKHLHEGHFCLRPAEGRKGRNTVPLLADTWTEHCAVWRVCCVAS